MCLWALRKDFCCGWNQTVLSHFIELSLVNSWMARSTPKIKALSQGTLRPCNINGRVVGRLTSLGLLVPACLPILCRLWERARRWGRCLCSPPSNWAGWQGGACAAQRTLYQETASHDVGQLMAPRQNRQQERDRERERETVLETARKRVSVAQCCNMIWPGEDEQACTKTREWSRKPRETLQKMAPIEMDNLACLLLYLHPPPYYLHNQWV